MDTLTEERMSAKGNPISFGKMYTAEEAGELLDCSKMTIYRAWKVGTLPFIQIGNRRKMTERMIEQVVADGGFQVV